MVHKRSPEAKARRAQRKEAREYIIRNSFNDTIIAESVSRTDPEEVADYLYYLHGQDFDDRAVPCTFKGVVLTDSYGRGVFQR